MAASSSSSSNNTRKICDIFLSHSGSQKLFTQILYEKLSQSNHTCFFDQDSDNSLRRGDYVECEIVKAIEECKLAVVVISREFITTFWPMLELQHILDKKKRLNANSFTVYPIFYKLAPSDLTEQNKLQLCKEEWKRIAMEKGMQENRKRKHDEEPTFDIVEKWANALAEVRVIAGSILTAQHMNEYNFIVKEVYPEICKICPAPRHYFGDHDFVKGEEAWIKEMDGTFNGIKDQMSNAEMGCKGVMVIGVHGIGGCGKSTLCKVMFDWYTQVDFPSMCGCLLLPTKKNEKEVVEQLEKAMEKIGIPSKFPLDDINEAVTTFVRHIKASRKKTFLAIDNVWPWSELYVRKILQCLHNQGLDKSIEGVKLIVTSRSAQLLQKMFQAATVEEYCYKVVPIPSITKEAALDTLMCYSGNENLNNHNETLLKKVNVLVEHCFFNGCYYPLILKAIASKLIQVNHNKEQVLDECINILKCGNYLEARKFEEDDVVQVLRSSFAMLDKNLQGIFLDITLQVTLQKVCGFGGVYTPLEHPDPLEGISMLYDDCDVNQLTSQCEKLEYLSFWKLKRSNDRQKIFGFEVHDLYVQLAKLEGKLTVHDWVCFKYEVDGLSRTKADLFRDRHVLSKNNKIRALYLSSWCEPIDGTQLSPLIGPQLRVLSLCSHYLRLQSIHGLDAAPNLVVLDASVKLSVVPNLQILRRLRWLSITRNRGLTQFEDLQLHHAKLERLVLSDCYKLVDLSGIDQHCPTLQYLNLGGCRSLKDLSGMQHCPTLQDLDLSGCRSLKDLSGMQHCPTLQDLDLSGCWSLKNLSGMQHCPTLQRLDLRCRSLKDLSGMQYCPALERLDLSGCRSLTDLNGMQHCPALKHLDLSGCQNLTDLGDMLHNCLALECLNLTNCELLQSLGDIILHCSTLQCLILDRCCSLSLKDFIGMQHYPALQHLGLSYCSSLQNLRDIIQHCPALEYLKLSHCPSLKDLSGMQHCPTLRHLDLSKCENLPSLGDIIQHCPTLRHLDLSGCRSLTDLGDMPKCCPTLEYLDLGECEVLESLGDMLQHCPALKYLYMTKCKKLNVSSIKLPSLEILELDSFHSLEESMAGAECLHEQLPILEKLKYENCRNPLNELPGLKRISSLRILEIRITKLFEFGEFVNTIAPVLNALARDLINLKTLEVYPGWDFREANYEKLANYLDPGWSVSSRCLQFKRS